jgi:hypothetical protein
MNGETVARSLNQIPPMARMMCYAILENSTPQIPQNEKPHRLRRLNLAVLNPTTILPTLTARETNLPRDSPALSDNPTTTLNTSNCTKPLYEITRNCG